MAKIAFILLCHKDPDWVAKLAEHLTSAGDCVAIHYDKGSSGTEYRILVDRLAANPNVVFAQRRVKCGWGLWSLVGATLEALKAATKAYPDATHFYMLSGDCAPIKSAEHVHAVLDGDDVDYIESFDFFESDWIKTGFREERLSYWHYFNERKFKSLFYLNVRLQRMLGMQRKIPKDIAVMIGSQWWCLRRTTVEAILDFAKRRRDVVRFFKYTWIPDETFFQTLVRHLIPAKEIRNRTQTFLMFSDYGMPVNFYDDQFDLLTRQDYLFARKISPHAHKLKAELGALYTGPDQKIPTSNDGNNLFRFLTNKGRHGERFEQRFWERGGKIGRDKTLLIVTCQKWHVAKRLVNSLNDIQSLEFIFSEQAAQLPDLGGIENSLDKRNRHRRALVGMIFKVLETNRLLICVDPADFDAIQDFYSDKAEVRLLEIECDYSDEFLMGHARRIGLATDQTAPEHLTSLLPTLRKDIQGRSKRIREAKLPYHFTIAQSNAHPKNADELARFLDIPTDQAQELVKPKALFSD